MPDAANFAAVRVDEPEVDDFADKVDNEPQLSPVSATAAVRVVPTDVTALAEAALPRYLSIAGGNPQPRPMGLP